MVCKANADLACVDVPVAASTPSYLYQGRTYHFCSEECRAAFAKDPGKYAGR
jgi:YHS domain-containing protein